VTESGQPTSPANWQEIVARYQQPSVARGTYQLVNTLAPYAALWVLMYFARPVSWWLVVPLALLAGAFLVRLFIIHHDCGHGSFFKSRKANDTIGFITGVLTFTPYFHWRWEHATHHATSGDLDRRGMGDICTSNPRAGDGSRTASRAIRSSSS
jgi:omega-6 fatty acid desaturase (delta-12 desaturase)